MKNYNGFYLKSPIGNNIFCYQDRISETKLRIAPLIHGTTEDLKIGSKVVFSEKDKNGIIHEYVGLKNFIFLKNHQVPIYIFDNHNHALYFWFKEHQKQSLKPGITLIHIDQHSDLNHNPFKIENTNLEQIFDFVQTKCNVGNFIQPALQQGLIEKVEQIRSEYKLLNFKNKDQDYILDIDLDFRAKEMGIEHFSETIEKTKKLMKKAKLVTIATSPYFLPQEQALDLLYTLLEK